MRFRFARVPIDTETARRELLDLGAGGYVSFEGWVRNFNEGREVTHLEYEAFESLALKEGDHIVAEGAAPLSDQACAVHPPCRRPAARDMAVWVGVCAAHRGEAFSACRFIIDEIKHRVPIWKKEHYRDGDSGWVNCEQCAAAPLHEHEHATARE